MPSGQKRHPLDDPPGGYYFIVAADPDFPGWCWRIDGDHHEFRLYPPNHWIDEVWHLDPVAGGGFTLKWHPDPTYSVNAALDNPPVVGCTQGTPGTWTFDPLPNGTGYLRLNGASGVVSVNSTLNDPYLVLSGEVNAPTQWWRLQPISSERLEKLRAPLTGSNRGTEAVT